MHVFHVQLWRVVDVVFPCVDERVEAGTGKEALRAAMRAHGLVFVDRGYALLDHPTCVVQFDRLSAYVEQYEVV